MGFEVYVKGSAPVASVPAVTVQKKGIISLNDSAFQLIDSPEAVELLWDPDRKAIAIRPSELANFNAYPTRRMQIKSGRGPVLIAGTLFTQYIGMSTEEARRWVPEVEDGMLVVDISKPGAPATSGRGRSKKKAVTTVAT